MFGPCSGLEHFGGEEDSAVHGDLVESDGLEGEESTCLKQFYVQHKVDVYANGAILVSPGF